MISEKKFDSSTEISNFIDGHVKTWAATVALMRSIDREFGNISQTEDWDKHILYASIYGASDSYSQSIGASANDTAAGIKIHVKSYADKDDVYRSIIIAGSMDELTDVVNWSGQCIYEIRVARAEVTPSYMSLIKRIRAKYQRK